MSIEAECINLKVLAEDKATILYKIKKKTPLRNLMKAYCDRVGLPIQVVRYRFDGRRFDDNDTATSLELEDGDTIEVYQLQTESIN